MEKRSLFTELWYRNYEYGTMFALSRPRKMEDPIFEVRGHIVEPDGRVVIVAFNIFTREYHAMVNDVPFGKYRMLK